MVSEATLKAIVEYGIFCSRHGAGQPVLTTVGAALVQAIEAEVEAAAARAAATATQVAIHAMMENDLGHA